MVFDFDPTIRGLDAAIREYASATIAAGDGVTGLLGVSVFAGGQQAMTLTDLRRQLTTHRSATNRRMVAFISAPREPFALFESSPAAAARLQVRSAVRLTHDVGFTLLDEIAVGEAAYAAIRSYGELSPLADQLARADHVLVFDAARTLGRPVAVHRDFVVRCAVLGLGDALNAEQEPDIPASVSVETWLSHPRIRQQRC